jgi:hypothetical protein
MTTSAQTFRWIVIGMLLAFGAVRAHAGDPCIGDAKQSFIECKADCKEAYQVAKDNCINRLHSCVEGCRAGRSECVDATPLDEDLALCRDTLRAAKDKCRTDHANDPEGTDLCIDQAQVVAFLCRKAARQKSRPAIVACRAGFRACVKACPPAESGEVIDPRQCKLDAKDAYLTCKSDCREDYQSQKDVCLNRDHACVEDCRAKRDTCRKPAEDQLDADIATCNATRDTAVTNCKNLYPEGDPNRETCITNAQIDAFECRDHAREVARPKFKACRDAFQTCAEACPPPQS